MAALATTHPTLLDVTKRMDPDGRIGTVAELLSQTNEILDDMPFFEGNLTTGHRSIQRTGIPRPTWRRINQGVTPGKSTAIQITDNCGEMSAISEIDKKLVDLAGDKEAFRITEDRAHIEGMNQEFCESLFYASEETDPEEITGLSPRYNLSTAANGENIIRPGGTTPDGSDNSSIWLVVWGSQTCFGIYPKGTMAGLQFHDEGLTVIDAPNGGKMRGYRSWFEWHVGLVVRDWRFVARAQFNSEDLTETAATGPDLVSLVRRLMRTVPALNAGKPALYMNNRSLTYLEAQMMNAVKNSTLTYKEIGQRMVPMFGPIPIRRCDSILNTESGVA